LIPEELIVSASLRESCVMGSPYSEASGVTRAGGFRQR